MPNPVYALRIADSAPSLSTMERMRLYIRSFHRKRSLKKDGAAFEAGARYFGIVTSGTRINDQDEWDEIYQAIAGLNEVGIKPCGSLGMLDDETARNLKKAGLFRYHHNLETSRSFFDAICSTHAYDEDIETVMTAKKAGLSVCSGGIIGLGENMEHRIELAMTLKELDVDSVPINILNPIEGTPLAGIPPLSPIEILLTVAIYRFILPDKDIKLCGGKEKNLRQLLPLAIIAGCNSFMTGNYLTTLGRDTEKDLEMIATLDVKRYQNKQAYCFVADYENWGYCLTDSAAEFEYGKIHGDNKAAEDDAEKHHDHRFHQGRHICDEIIHIFIIEIRYFSQHAVEGAC